MRCSISRAGRDDFAIPAAASRLPQKRSARSPAAPSTSAAILFTDKGEWKVRITGQQGSGVLRSMAEANCFIVLEHERGAVAAGEPVSVQLFEGLA